MGIGPAGHSRIVVLGRAKPAVVCLSSQSLSRPIKLVGYLFGAQTGQPFLFKLHIDTAADSS